MDGRRFFEWLGGLALGMWVGGQVTIIVAARAIFGVSGSDRRHAGTLVTTILADFRRLEFACAAAVVLGALFLMSRPATRRDVARVIIAALMTSFLAAYALWIAPELLKVREQVGSFDIPLANDPQPARHLFHTLHQLYTGLSGANLLLGIVLWSIWRRPATTPQA